MSNLPDGSLADIRQIEQRDSRYQHALEKNAALIKLAAKSGGQIHWTICDGLSVSEKPGEFIADFMPQELLQLACGAWLADDSEAMAMRFHAACEIAFDNAVQFLADKEA